MKGLKRAGLIALAAALAAVWVSPAMADTAEGGFSRTLQVTGPVELSVQTGSGDITVTTGASGTIQIQARIKARDSRGMSGEEKVRAIEQNPPIEQTGNVIRIGEIDDEDLKRRVSISYVLVVPAATSLRSATGSGDHKVGGIAGPVNAATGSGEISLSDIGAEVKVATGSGNITLTSIKGGVRASTGSGNVRLVQTGAGDVSVATGSGRVDVSGVQGELSLATGSGSLQAAGTPTGAWKLAAGSGDIVVRLPSDASFDLEARSDSGTVESAHPVTVTGEIKRGRLRGKVRGGGVLIRLRSGSGDIRVE